MNPATNVTGSPGGRTILAGDIGGTKTVLALFELVPGGIQLIREQVYPSAGHASLEEILALFLSSGTTPPLSAGCFGVAGPVIEGECRTTNLPWYLSEKSLAQATAAPRVKLLNDLEAMAYGMLFLSPEQLATLQPGQPRKGNIAVVAAGTGLGEAILYWDGATYHPIATEGGHADFAPRNDREIELLNYLLGKLEGRVSVERVLSGPGFWSIYEFLRDREIYPEPDWVRERFKKELPNEVISELGMQRKDPLCEATVEMFLSIYGAEAGNLALKCLSVGGVYIGGGIAPKILPALRGRGFLQAFSDKGRLVNVLAAMPLAVCLEPRTPLLGAAHYTARLVQ